MTYLDDDPSNEDGGSGEAGEANNDGGSDNQNNSGEGNDNKPTFDASAITKEQFAELLARDDFKGEVLKDDSVIKEIQSQKDKEIAKEKRRITADQRSRDEATQVQEDARTRRDLIADGKGDDLITFENSKLEERELLTQSASKVARIIEDVVRQQPEFRSLGEDKIDEVYAQIEKDQGNVIDFTLALSRARRDVDVATATKAATDSVRDTMKAEIDAALVEAGVKERSANVEEGNAPSNAITNDNAPRTNVKATTWEEISLGYGNGTVSTERYEAAKLKHDEEIRY